MQPILSSNVAHSLAGQDALLAFDYDGTLAPIVDDPAAAAKRPPTRHRMAQVAPH
jgi:trehalose 6-phosphate phosphatase